MDKIFNLKKYLIFILAFALPLVFVNDTNELYEFPKTYVLYVLGTLIIFLFIVEKLYKSESIKLPSIHVTFYLLSAALAVLFSMHKYTSVWGYYTRFSGGLVSILVLIGLYIVFINSSKDFLKKVFDVTLFSIIPVSLYGIVQHYSVLSFIWDGSAQERVYSTFGQPNWLAQYLIVLLPIVFYKYLKAEKKMFWLSIFALGYACLWFTYSISGLLGFVASMLLIGAFFKKAVFSKLTFALIIVCFLVSVLNLGIFKAKVTDIFTDLKKVSVIVKPVFAQSENTSAIANKLSDPGFIRTGLWKGTIALVVSSPKIFFIGSGLETYPYAFQPFRPLELNYSSEWDFVFNKPHNYFLEIWSQSGLFGLVAYGLLCLKIFKSKRYVFIAATSGFLVSNIFGWPSVFTAFLFWLILAFVDIKDESRYCFVIKQPIVRFGVFGGLILVFLCGTYKFGTLYLADMNYEASSRALSASELGKALKYANSSIELNPQEPNYYKGRARILIAAAYAQDEASVAILKSQALADLETAYNLNPHNLVTIRNIVPLYYYLSVKNLGLSQDYDAKNIDEAYLEKTKTFYSFVKDISPNDAGVYTLFAKYEKRLGLVNEYSNSVNKVSQLRPDLLEWHENFK